MLVKITKNILLFSLTALCCIVNVSWAQEKLPSFNCTLTDTASDDAVGVKKDTFAKDTKMIYLICDSENVKKGQNFKAVWIATDTNNAAPSNYQIDEAELNVDANLNDFQLWNAKFSLSKPDSGWPIGKYRVELYMGKELILIEKFDVK